MSALHLYVVVYILGQIGITVGPIPSKDMHLCQTQIVSATWVPFDNAWKRGRKFVIDGHEIKRSDMNIQCEWHDKAPALTMK